MVLKFRMEVREKEISKAIKSYELNAKNKYKTDWVRGMFSVMVGKQEVQCR